MTSFQMYCLIKLDVLACVSNVICVFSGLAFLVFSAVIGFSKLEKDSECVREVFQKFRKTTSILFLFSAPIAFFTPNTKEAATIIIVPKIVNSTVVQQDLPELYDLGKKWVKDKISK